MRRTSSSRGQPWWRAKRMSSFAFETTALCCGVPATVTPCPRRTSSSPSSRSTRSARRTVLAFTWRTAASAFAEGSRSPGLISPSAIARRISAATCSKSANASDELSRKRAQAVFRNRQHFVGAVVEHRTRSPRPCRGLSEALIENVLPASRIRRLTRREEIAVESLHEVVHPVPGGAFDEVLALLPNIWVRTPVLAVGKFSQHERPSDTPTPSDRVGGVMDLIASAASFEDDHQPRTPFAPISNETTSRPVQGRGARECSPPPQSLRA